MSRFPRRARLLALSLSVSGALVATLAIAPAAQASTPQQRAAALAKQVKSLQGKAEAATEAYDAAEGQLGIVVSAALTAEANRDQAIIAAATTQETNVNAISSLYELGGPGVMYASVLASGGDPEVVQTRLVDIRAVLAQDHLQAATTDVRSDAAEAAQTRANTLAAQQTVLEGQVAQQSQNVQDDLAQTQALLATTNAQIQAIAAADEAAALAADHAAFLAQLAAAQSADVNFPPLPSSPQAAAALAAAEALTGHPYQWGGTGPVGYDCSGMVGAAYAAAGISMPRTAAQDYNTGPHVPLGQLEPGDLLFWASDPTNPATIDHVAIYAGEGLMMSADHTGDVVRLQPVWWNGFAGATRPVAATAAAVAGPRWAPNETS